MTNKDYIRVGEELKKAYRGKTLTSQGLDYRFENELQFLDYALSLAKDYEQAKGMKCPHCNKPLDKLLKRE